MQYYGGTYIIVPLKKKTKKGTYEKMSGITALDFTILDFIQAHLRTAFGDAVMPVITALGNSGIIWILLALVLLCIPKCRPLGLTVAAALAVDVILCNGIIKPLVARIRPYDINTAVTLIISAPTDYSFPSGHTAASFAAVTALGLKKTKWWIPALVLALLIAFSRLYLYVHYPSDVLAGVVIGVLAGFAGKFIADWIIRWREKRKMAH